MKTKNTFLLLVVLLLTTPSLRAQSTLVSGQVTDTNTQTWNNGTISFQFLNLFPQGGYIWTGGPFNPNAQITASLNATGGYSNVSVPSNTSITPAGSFWRVVVCSGTVPPSCISQNATITGATQTINFTPAPPIIPPGAGNNGYADNEIQPMFVGGQYYNVVLQQLRICQVVVAGFCTTWASGAAPGAQGLSGQTQANVNGALAGAACETFSNVATGPLNVNCDWIPRGANPYVDVRQYGVRGLASTSSTPAVAGITGSITATQTTLTVSTASCPLQTGSVCFVNGDGIVVYGAGPATALTTPGAPTVVPSVARVGTGTGDTAPGPTGATAYQYQIVARDRQGGLTAASTTTAIANGQASLGSQSVATASVSCSGTTVTVTTSTPHTLAVGAQILMNTTAGGNSCIGGLGTYQVATVPDTTHFTYQQGISTVNGGATASSSTFAGTVIWMNCNHITWTAVPNTWQYYIYGRTSGSMALLGVTHPSAGGINDTTFDDFGATMMAQSTLGIPGYVPTTPPGSATPQPLVTTIASGAGTTSLTLAGAASTTVVNSTVLFTDGPNIVTAATAAPNLYWPAKAGSFVVNSFTDLSAINSVWMYTGGLVLNETLAYFGSWMGQTPNTAVGTSAGQFNFMLEPGISTNANPGVYVAQFGAGFFDRLAFIGGQNPVFFDQGGVPSGPQFGQHVSFGTVNNSTDYMGIALYMRGTFGVGSVNGIRAGRINIQTGPGQQGGGFTGSTFTPGFFISDLGTMKIDALFMNNRGLLIRPDNGTSLKVDFGYTQGGITPFITIGGQPTGSTSGMTLEISNLVDDTTSQPYLTYLPSANTVNVTAFVGALANFPQGQTPVITGPTAGWTVNGTTSGQNTNTIALPNFTDNSVQVLGVGNQGFQLLPPAAPTVAISGGVGPAAGTYYYSVIGVDPYPSATPTGSTIGFGNSPLSQPSTPITVNGSQGVLVSWTLQPGQTSTIICRNTSPTATFCPDNSQNSFRVSGTSYLDNGTSNFLRPAGGFTGLSAGINSSGLYGQQLTLTGGGFTSKQAGVFTANRTVTWGDGSPAFPANNGIVPVSSYQNQVYDNFNRANGALGSNWTTGTGTVVISSNQATGTGGANNSTYWGANTFHQNQFSQVTIVSIAATLRAGAGVLMSGVSYYSCEDGATSFFILKSGGVSTSTAHVAVVGDVVRTEVLFNSSGNPVITCFLNGAVELTFTDSTSPLTSGSPGFTVFGTSGQDVIDNWSGGNLHPIAQLDVEQDWTQPQHFIGPVTVGPVNPVAGTLPAGSLTVSALITSGTITLSGTGACATLSNQTGGAWAGAATCTGTTGAATFTITPTVTAPHFYNCWGSDSTAGHLLAGVQSTTLSGSCSLTFTSVTNGDAVTITAVAF